MAGKPQAPTLKYEPKFRRWRLRFTYEGQRYDFKNSKLRESEKAKARRWAHDKEEEVYSGEHARRVEQGSDPEMSVIDAGAHYLAEAVGGFITEETAKNRKMHIKKHLGPFFKTLRDATDEGRLYRYQAERLKSVQYATVKKELSTLRLILSFAKRQRWISRLPPFPEAPRKTKGTVHKYAPRGFTKDLTDEHLIRVVVHLPELCIRDKKDGRRWPLQAFFALILETGLRPGTLWGMRKGKHWRPGQEFIRVTADIDKNRYERDVPISDWARKILEGIDPAPNGQFFKRKDLRVSLRKAARAAGLPQHLHEAIHTYDFRHVAATVFVNSPGAILSGASFLLGHKQTTTTNKYTHADERHAATTLEKLGKTRAPSSHSGAQTGTKKKPSRRLYCSQPRKGLVFSCAKKRTRTSTGVTPLAPQGCALFPASGIYGREGSLWIRNDPPAPVHSGAEPQNGFFLAAALHRLGLLPETLPEHLAKGAA